MDHQLPLFYYFCNPIPSYYFFQAQQPNIFLQQNRKSDYQLSEMEKECLKPQQPVSQRKQKRISESNIAHNKQFVHRKLKKNLCFKKLKQDGDFKQRQQTPGRNLCSNTLKIYFKQLRDQNSQTFDNIKKIIASNGLDYTPQLFFKKVNDNFPLNKTYISFENVKSKCNYYNQNEEDTNFAKVLRISIRKFFAYEIFTANVRSLRTTKRIKNQQIKQGKYFVRELTL